MDFDAMIERNNRGEIRVLLIALFGMALLVMASVVIAVKDVTAATARQDGAAILSAATARQDGAAILSAAPDNHAATTARD